MKTSTKIWIAIGCVFGLFLIYWVGSIFRCEYLTKRYGDQFQDAYKEYTMVSSQDYLKVLEYTETKAVIYTVIEDGCGNTITFKRANKSEEWEFVEWNTIWSTSGSADGFIWPYIR